MRKVVGLCVLVVLALLATRTLFSQPSATTRYVNNTDPTCQGHSPCYPTIQAAVNAAQRGDTIRIQAGTYTEQITITGKNNVAGATEADRILIEADPTAPLGSVVLRGANQQCEDGYAIQLKTSKFITLRGLTITGAGGPAISLMGSTNQNQVIHLERNRIFGNGSGACASGISISKGNPDTLIVNNLIYGNGQDGITFQSATGSKSPSGPHHVINNTIRANGGNGVVIVQSHEVLLVNNLITQNGTAGDTEGGFGIKRQGDPKLPPQEIQLLNNLLCGNRLGELKGPILDSTDAGNLTPGGQEGMGVSASPGCEVPGTVFQSINGLDGLANTADDDFTLIVTSPAIDKGADPRTLGLGAPNVIFEADFSGEAARPQDGDSSGTAEFDLGALEKEEGGCQSGETQSCYEGPPGTEGKGQCKAGTRTCRADGTFGPCEGQVLPGSEIPGNNTDEDCNGRAEQCAPGTTEACYEGPPGTQGIGQCKAGTRTCGADGTFGTCQGQVLPGEEIPGNGTDEDCDGSDSLSLFTLTAAPNTVGVIQGQSVSYIVTLNSAQGFTQLATLSVAGLPASVSGSFSPGMLTAGQSATLTIQASENAALASALLTISAAARVAGADVTHSTSANLTVIAGGRTALLGQFTLVDGTPLRGVKLTLVRKPDGAILASTETDSGGNFQFLDDPPGSLPAGTHTLGVDATPADPKFPIYGVDVTLIAGQAVRLSPFRICPPPPPERFTPIQNATQDQVITDPRFPGAAFTLPAGSTITGWDGVPKTQMAIERLSPDRLPVPPPPGPTRSLYQPFFGTPRGGVPSAPIPVTLPNDLDLNPGDKAELWYYDAAPFPDVPGEWRMAGLATVSEDGTRIVSDEKLGDGVGDDDGICEAGETCVGIERFCGVCGLSCIIPKQEGQPNHNPDGPTGGDPADLALGQMIVDKTDLVLPGRIPAVLHRTYNPFEPFGAIAGFELGLGPGWALSVEVVLQAETATLHRIILPGNSRFAFVQQPDGTFVNTTHPRFAGAVLTAQAGGGHILRLKDGTLWRFAPSTRVVGLELLAEQTDRNGNRLTIEHDLNNKVTRLTEPAGRQLVFTYTTGRLTEVKDPLGRTVRYGYDSNRRLETVTDAAGGVTRYTYDSAGRILTITDPKGIVFLRNEYSPLDGRILKQTQADGGVWTFLDVFVFAQCPAPGPCFSGHVGTTVIDPRGNTTFYRLTPDGFTSQITDAFGQTTKLERDARGQIVAITDPIGRVTRFEYDAAGNVTRITDPAGNVRRFEYEPTFNLLTKLTDPLGNVTTFAYDARGNLTRITDPLGNVTQVAYNAFGQPTSTTDPLGDVTTFTYDSQGNLATIADPLGNTSQRTYDLVSRLTAQTDPRSKTTRFTYDDLNRITQIVDAINGATRFTYDENGNLLTATDALNHATAYAYDNMDRLIRRADPVGASESFEYDRAGNLTRHNDRKGQLSTFSYDALNRRAGATYADSTTSFIYDAVGRLVQASDSVGGDILNSYDVLDRLSQQTAVLGTIQYTYDALGRRTSMSVPGQTPVLYSYDDNSRLTRITQGSQVVDFAYDVLGRRARLTLPNGVSTEYNYDTASRFTELTYTNTSTNTLLGNLTYQYDAAGNRTQVGGSFARTLLPDPVTPANYDAANHQLTFGDKTMSFDPNGNLTSITDPSGVTNFTWDVRDRLIALTSPGATASFTYDPFGRRVSKRINSQVTQYLYDGLDTVQEVTNGTPINSLRSLNIDELLVRNNAEYILADALGSTIALTSPAGSVQTEYTYEPFGRTTVTGATTNSFQYMGRENDGTGLDYYRARYYSPVLHRFVSEDPIGLAGGMNLYSYVGNSPVNFIDPEGLSVEEALHVVIEIVNGLLHHLVDERRREILASAVKKSAYYWNPLKGSAGRISEAAYNEAMLLARQNKIVLAGSKAFSVLGLILMAPDAIRGYREGIPALSSLIQAEFELIESNRKTSAALDRYLEHQMGRRKDQPFNIFSPTQSDLILEGVLTSVIS